MAASAPVPDSTSTATAVTSSSRSPSPRAQPTSRRGPHPPRVRRAHDRPLHKGLAAAARQGLRDKPQFASSTWMAAIAADYVPGFGQARVEQLALAHPFETVKSQAQAP